MVNDFHTLPYDYVSVQPSQIRNLHFRLADYRGRRVDMLHTGLSCSLLFVPEDMFKCFIVAAFLASIIFLIIDVIWLSFATKSFYRPLLGDLISDKPVLWAAGLFYLLYMFGMAVIVIQPCIEPSGLSKSLYTGFIFGLLVFK